jgi:hypothetical protein
MSQPNMHGQPPRVRDAVVHLHTPTGRTYCGAPAPADRRNGWTAYRSDATCPECLAPRAQP